MQTWQRLMIFSSCPAFKVCGTGLLKEKTPTFNFSFFKNQGETMRLWIWRNSWLTENICVLQNDPAPYTEGCLTWGNYKGSPHRFCRHLLSPRALGCREVQFTWTFFLDLVMPTRNCRNSCSSCTSPCHGTRWMEQPEILPDKIQEMPMLGQKLLSQHLCTATTKTFLCELVCQLLINCWQKTISF